MALLNIFDIAGSALTAQSKRLNVAASNTANADSVAGLTDSLIVRNRWSFRWMLHRARRRAA